MNERYLNHANISLLLVSNTFVMFRFIVEPHRTSRLQSVKTLYSYSIFGFWIGWRKPAPLNFRSESKISSKSLLTNFRLLPCCPNHAVFRLKPLAYSLVIILRIHVDDYRYLLSNELIILHRMYGLFVVLIRICNCICVFFDESTIIMMSIACHTLS